MEAVIVIRAMITSRLKKYSKKYMSCHQVKPRSEKKNANNKFNNFKGFHLFQALYSTVVCEERIE